MTRIAPKRQQYLRDKSKTLSHMEERTVTSSHKDIEESEMISQKPRGRQCREEGAVVSKDNAVKQQMKGLCH